jgi:hypothetical protein
VPKQNKYRGDTMSQSNNTVESRRNKHLTLRKPFAL